MGLRLSLSPAHDLTVNTPPPCFWTFRARSLDEPGTLRVPEVISGEGVIRLAVPIRIAHWVTLHVNMLSLGQRMQYNVSFESSPDVSSPLALNDLCQQVYTAILTPWKPIHTNVTSLTSVTAESQYPGAVNYAGIYAPATTQFGTNAGDPVPLNVAAVYKLETGVRGRRYRGRIYLGAIGEGDVSGNTLGSGYLANSAAFIAALLTTRTLGTGPVLRPVVASRAGLFLTPFYLYSADNLVDSQRRRLTGRGR